MDGLVETEVLRMNWTENHKLREAVNEHGYKVTWASNKHGLWFNAFTPTGKHISGGYKRDKVEAECEAHHLKLEVQRAMSAAKRASTEVV